MCVFNVKLSALCGHLTYTSERCAAHPRCPNPHSKTSTRNKTCKQCQRTLQHESLYRNTFTFCDPRTPCTLAGANQRCHGWEKRRLVNNQEAQVYFLDLNNNSMTFKDPRAIPPVINNRLPKGWTRNLTPDGRMYYVDHNTKTTTFNHPGIFQVDTSTPLPKGWKMFLNPGGRSYFVDMRIEEEAKHAKAQLAWRNGEVIRKAFVEAVTQQLQEGQISKNTPFIRKTLQRLNYLLKQYDKTNSHPSPEEIHEVDERRIEFLQRVVLVLNTSFNYHPSDEEPSFEWLAQEPSSLENSMTAGIASAIETILIFPHHDRLNYIFREPQALNILLSEQSTCPLCEEDFRPAHQAVQLLPCSHIYCHCCVQKFFSGGKHVPFLSASLSCH